MKLLLDTQALVLWYDDDAGLSPRARTAIADPGNAVHVSVASLWEWAIKESVGKLLMPAELAAAPDVVLAGDRMLVMEITARHVVGVRTLPRHHRDPFDRLLVAQALADGLTVVTGDAVFARYGVPVLW